MPLNSIQPYNVNTTADFTFSTVNVTSSVSVGSNIIANTTRLTLNVGVSANGSLGAAGQGLLSNGTSVYWSDVVTTKPLVIALVYR